MNPNTLVVGAQVHDALRNNPDVIERVKYVMAPERATAVTMETLGAYFGVDHYVVGSTMTSEPRAFEHVWGKLRNPVKPFGGLGRRVAQHAEEKP